VFAYCVFFVYYVVCVFTTTISLVKNKDVYIVYSGVARIFNQGGTVCMFTKSGRDHINLYLRDCKSVAGTGKCAV